MSKKFRVVLVFRNLFIEISHTLFVVMPVQTGIQEFNNLDSAGMTQEAHRTHSMKFGSTTLATRPKR